MALVTVVDVVHLHNPTKFMSPICVEITFECHAPGLRDDLEWKLVYVGSASDERADQELDTVLVGPVNIGRNKFVFEVPPPNHTRIPEDDLLETTVMLLTCAYGGAEFIRIGYFVNNEYELNEEQQKQIQQLYEEAVEKDQMVDMEKVKEIRGPIDINKVWRNIVVDAPRVTKFIIAWDQQMQQFPELTQEERNALEEQAQTQQTHMHDEQMRQHQHDAQQQEDDEVFEQDMIEDSEDQEDDEEENSEGENSTEHSTEVSDENDDTNKQTR